MTGNPTPGPWTIGDPPDFHYSDEHIQIDIATQTEIGIDAHGWAQLASVVVRFEGDERESPTGQANARLIAAAPELLETLESVFHNYEGHKFKDHKVHPLCDAYVLLGRLGRLSKAGRIKPQAKGEA